MSFKSNLFLSIAILFLLIQCKTKEEVVVQPEASRGINLQYLDTTVSPKTDFFRFVNGTWLDSTEIPADRTTWGSFNELRKQTDEDMLAIIDRASKNPEIKSGSDPYKAVALYKTILDTVTRNKHGVEPIKPYIQKINAIATIADLQSFLLSLQKEGNHEFFSFNIGADDKDSNQNSLYLGPSGLGLPDRDYYVKDDTDSKEKREKYKAHIARMLQFLDISNEEAIAMASDILAFEIELSKPRLDKVERRDARKTYNPMTVATLGETISKFDWDEYIKGLELTGVDSLIVSQPAYMSSLQELITTEKLPVIKAHLTWGVINSAASRLSTAMERASWEFYSQTLGGAKEQLSAKERALSVVNNTVGESLGQLYVDEKFPPEAKEKAEEMIANVITAYETRIKALPWMSEKTKTLALKKLGTTSIKIGYPDNWKDYSTLTIKGPEDGGTYFENVQAIRAWNYQKDLDKLDEPVDKTEWFMSPQTVNAYYNPSYNEIVFPAAILQPPFYDYKADAAVNYGGIGAVIGHEISHGFDDSGARYDAEGNLNDWWTAEDLTKFEGLGENLADQYSAIEVLPETFINGKFTLGENIGDLGGVTAAYDGLQLHFKKHGKPEPIDGYTAEQRFFMSWATVWRTKMRDEALKSRIKTDPHSPGMYRAYVPLTNIDAFYEAFEVTEEDKMFVPKEERIYIW